MCNFKGRRRPFFCFGVQAQETTTGDIAALKAKIDTLTKMVRCQDSSLKAHADKINEETAIARAHDSAIEEIKTRLHRQYGTPAIGDSGFVIGVGATMVLQATDNPNAVSLSAKRVGMPHFQRT